jgi:hypothetical protein
LLPIERDEPGDRPLIAPLLDKNVLRLDGWNRLPALGLECGSYAYWLALLICILPCKNRRCAHQT